VPGFLTTALRYREERVATIGLSLVGGLIASAATLAWPWTPEETERAWWIALLGAGLVVAGGGLLIRSPDRLGATRLTDPVRALGSLLASAGAPLLLAPVGVWVSAEIRTAPVEGASIAVGGWL
jgi:hypothetical protein